ncbi:MAG: 50S ribosomal protein L29 [Clostridiales bacterium]|nr:50S ribosomal protein L29 [Clostridiales bacterium]
MEAKDIRELSGEELLKKEKDLKAELFNLRFRLATGQLDNPMMINRTKKDMARVKTIIREREIKAEKQAKAQ